MHSPFETLSITLTSSSSNLFLSFVLQTDASTMGLKAVLEQGKQIATMLVRH